MTLITKVPRLLVGFDVESTGLDTQNDEAISYGFAEFHDGTLVSTEEFFVVPDVQIHPGAEKIHGVSYEHLRRLFRDGAALSATAGATRATARLLQYAARGAVFVGANPMFDYTMLDSTLRRQNSVGLLHYGFNIADVTIVDVVRHDLEIEPSRSIRSRRGLAFLCEHYDITPGCHQASQDARAACEVLLAQVNVAQSLGAQSIDTLEHHNPTDSSLHRFVDWVRGLAHISS